MAGSSPWGLEELDTTEYRTLLLRQLTDCNVLFNLAHVCIITDQPYGKNPQFYSMYIGFVLCVHFLSH